MKPLRLYGLVLSGFAVLGSVLAAVGVFSLLATFVTNRRRELGLRLALGADRRALFRLIMADGLRIGLLGVAIGIPLGHLLYSRLRASIFGLGPLDWSVTAMTAIAVAGIAMAASAIPAYRAASTDPVTSIRT